MLPNIMKVVTYIVNHDEHKSTGTLWVALYVNKNTFYHHFDMFGIEYILKEMKKFIVNKNAANIYRMQAYNSIMCGYFCIGFIDFIFKGKSLTDFTNLFSPHNFKKNEEVILSYFLK